MHRASSQLISDGSMTSEKGQEHGEMPGGCWCTSSAESASGAEAQDFLALQHLSTGEQQSTGGS